MALSPVAGVARVVFRGLAITQPIVNVMHVLNGGGPPGTPYTQGQIDQLVTSMSSLFIGNLVPLCNSQYVSVDCSATDLSSELGVSAVINTTGAGTGSGVSTPNAAACCISWKIARHYRGGHPRTYMGPLAQLSISTGTTLSAAYITQANTAATAFRTAVNALVLSGSTQRLVCVHRIRDGVQLPEPLVDVITGNSVDSRIDTQRRRLGRDR